jgi:hypothetical protein
VRDIVTLPALYVIGRFGLRESSVNPGVSRVAESMVMEMLLQDESFKGGIVRESENCRPSANVWPTALVL